jgi:hypothetical protein
MGFRWSNPIPSHPVKKPTHTVQLILGVFIDSLKLKATNETVPTSLRKGKIAKVVGMPPGFKKIIEKVRKRLLYVIVGIIIQWPYLFISQVRQMAIAILASPQRNGYLLRLQEGREEIIRGMIRDVSTRWNSTLLMLDRALALKLYIRHWVDNYPAYRGLLLTEDEWLLLEDILTILQPFRFYTLWISTTKTITIHRSLEVYSAIILRLERRYEELKHARLDWKVELRTAIAKTLDYARRLWDNLDSVHLSENERPVYPNSNRPMPIREDTILDLAAMLDPFNKLDNFRGWDKEDAKAGIQREVTWTASYRQRFIEYWKQHYAQQLEAPRVQRKRRWATAFASDSDTDSNDDDTRRDTILAEMQKLVEEYLDGRTELPLDKESDSAELALLVANKDTVYRTVMKDFYSQSSSILRWWMINGDRKELYPLVQMARDILATPAAAVACEAAFSSGRDLCHYRRSKMKPETITRSMICKHYDRATIDQDVGQQDGVSNDETEKLQKKLSDLEIAASQFDVVINLRAARRRKKAQRDFAVHIIITEGTEGTERDSTLAKSLGQLEHDGDIEFHKPLPELPEKRFTKAQPLLPRAAGNEDEEPAELQPTRANQKLPDVNWDAVSDLSSSDSEEERQQREE